MIKLPVKYDPKIKAIRDCDFGGVIADLDRSFTSTETTGEFNDRIHLVGEHIAKVLNEYPALISRVEQLEKEKANHAEKLMDIYEEFSYDSDYRQAMWKYYNELMGIKL